VESLVLKKCGMTQVFRNNRVCPVTVLQKVQILQLETKGDRSLCLVKTRNKIKKPQLGTIKKFSLNEKVGCLKELDLSYELKEGDKVKLRSTSKGKGFCGTIKRFGFHGLRASHGTSITHRHAGSSGNRTDLSKVVKNRPMPGRHGGFTTSILNAVIVQIKDDYVLVKGSVPGAEGSLVWVRKKEVF
jgi:large subunit ribosomal protein L3